MQMVLVWGLAFIFTLCLVLAGADNSTVDTVVMECPGLPEEEKQAEGR